MDPLIDEADKLLSEINVFFYHVHDAATIKWTHSPSCPTAENERMPCNCDQGIVTPFHMQHFDHSLETCTRIDQQNRAYVEPLRIRTMNWMSLGFVVARSGTWCPSRSARPTTRCAWSRHPLLFYGCDSCYIHGKLHHKQYAPSFVWRTRMFHQDVLAHDRPLDASNENH